MFDGMGRFLSFDRLFPSNHLMSLFFSTRCPSASRPGELGRHGLMITKDLGSCLKLATVTTDLPLAHDGLRDIGVDEFCRDCRICARTCPGECYPAWR
jgi:hypothetical protein